MINKRIVDLSDTIKELRELSVTCEDIAQDLYEIYKQFSEIDFVCKCGKKLKFDYSIELWYCQNCNKHYELKLIFEEVEL